MAIESEEEEGGERREVEGQKYSQGGQLVPSSVKTASNQTKNLGKSEVKRKHNRVLGIFFQSFWSWHRRPFKQARDVNLING